ncbi:MAG: thioredoxin [Promethearchaeota archaeon]
MFDEELERIRMKKVEMLLKRQSMPRGVLKIHSKEEYFKLLKDYPEKIIVIDFWATWCAPCMSFAPIFERIQQEYPNFIFIKVNVDENSIIASQYRITGIPTTLFVKNGKVINKFVGAMNYNNMKQILEKFKSNNH